MIENEYKDRNRAASAKALADPVAVVRIPFQVSATVDGSPNNREWGWWYQVLSSAAQKAEDAGLWVDPDPLLPGKGGLRKSGQYRPGYDYLLEFSVTSHVGGFLVQHGDVPRDLAVAMCVVLSHEPGPEEEGLSMLTWLVERLPPVQTEATKNERPILPVAPLPKATALVTVREMPERTAGRVAFGGIIEGRNLPEGQLPLFPAPAGHRVAILELSDLAGVETMKRGRGAPLGLRLAVGACILTEHATRGSRGRMAVTVRELRDFLFPNRWQRGRDWPKVRKALWRARDYGMPDERGGIWLPFSLRYDPGADAALNDLVLIDIELPPGSANGPAIDRRELAQRGVTSGPEFRAFVAGKSLVWMPGKTRVRYKGRWTWSADPERYPVLTLGDRRRLAFGAGDKKNRTRSAIDSPWLDIPGVEIVKDVTPSGQDAGLAGDPCRGERGAGGG